MTKILALLTLLTVILIPCAEARQQPRGGSVSKSGARGGQASGTRTVKGPKSQSTFNATSANGKSLSGQASSTVLPGQASGQATVSTSGGRGLTAEGSATKTETGVSASGTVTTESGKTATGSFDGNQEAGTASVTTGQNKTRTKSYRR